MSDDLKKRLRDTPNWMREGFQDWKDNMRTYDRAPFEAADRIEELEAELRKAVGALGDISNGEPEWPDDPQKELDWCRNRATTALAELTGGKDE